MRSPFEIFRKHQKMLTVILTGLAMFAFVILGAVQDPGNMPPALVAIFLAGVVGGIGWLAGVRAKKSKEWGLSGVIAGLILGVAATLASGPQDVVQADSGNIDRQQLQYLFYQRDKANQFVNRTFARARDNGAQGFQPPRPFGFRHPDSARDVVLGEILRREADRLGLEVSDESVNDFIRYISQGQVGASDVKEIRDFLDLSESELYDILKQEVKAQTMAEFLYGIVTLPPENYWDYYRQMHIQQSVGIVPVPVDAFIDRTGEPTEAELQEMFAEYKSNYPNTTIEGRLKEGNPGFRQSRKVRLAAVEVPYEAIEQTVGEVSDEEIEAFYEEFYKTIPIPDPSGDGTDEGTGPLEIDAPILPELGAPTTEPSADSPQEGDTPPDGEKPADPAPDADSPQPDSTEDSPEAPAPDAADSAPEDKPESAPADEPEGGDTPKSEQSGASIRQRHSPLQFVSFFDDDAGETTEGEPTQPAEPAAEEESLPTTPPPPPTPRTRQPNADADTPAGENALSAPLLPRELDDELRDEIRDQILRRRTLDRMQELVSEVSTYMLEDILEVLYDVALPDEEGQDVSYEQAGEKLRKFAEERGLVYDETPLLTLRELGQSEEYPIGRAVSDSNLQATRNVAGMAFDAGPTELFRPETVLEIESGSRFVFWKIEDQEAYEANSLDDPGIREQVVKTWRELQARVKAQERADELAKQADGVDKPLSEIFTDTTLTGKEDGQVVSIIHPPRFSWLSRANVSPTSFNRPPPTRTNLRSVPGLIGDLFMETVVNDLQPGEVGVTHSIDKTYFYVVRIDERTYGLSADLQAFRDRFTSEPVFAPSWLSDYSTLADQQRFGYGTNWVQELFDRHQVDFSRWDQQQNDSGS